MHVEAEARVGRPQLGEHRKPDDGQIGISPRAFGGGAGLQGSSLPPGSRSAASKRPLFQVTRFVPPAQGVNGRPASPSAPAGGLRPSYSSRQAFGSYATCISHLKGKKRDWATH